MVNQPKLIIVYCDGSCDPNPGGSGTWAWVAYVNGRESSYATGYFEAAPENTNNRMEYQAVIEALKRAQRKGVSINVRTDSRLVVRQCVPDEHGKLWQVNVPHLRPLQAEVAVLLRTTRSVLAWIPREQNTRADELTRVAYADARKVALP